MKNIIFATTIFFMVFMVSIVGAQLKDESPVDVKYIEVKEDLNIGAIKDEKMVKRIVDTMSSTTISSSLEALKISEAKLNNQEIISRLDKIISLLQVINDKTKR